jgi:hypothetical protein
MRFKSLHALTPGLLLLLAAGHSPAQSRNGAPRIWNDRDLAEWATPIAALNVRPGHLSEKEFYSLPVAEWVRTYPVYFPGREPEGYWKMLQKTAPEPLITPGTRSTSEWVAAGKRVFEEMDNPALRTYDAQIIATIRSAQEFEKLGGHALKDGTVFGWRWAPTSKGLALTVGDCAACHTRIMPDGAKLLGAQGNERADGLAFQVFRAAQQALFPGDSPAMSLWRQFAAPWIANDVHDQFKTMQLPEIGALFASNPLGTIARFNGSPWHPTPISDLIGIKDRKYLDHNATHRMRGPEDIARYAALVACCDSGDFGPHHMLAEGRRLPAERVSDELVYSLGQYIYALGPPTNPNAGDPLAAAGRKVFEREGCGSCHPAPLFTNNKLTLAKGWTPPRDHPNHADILPVSVGTEPAAALTTRKGTGFYKVPSLKGLWYREMLTHDGSVATLEEWFDSARLRDDYVSKGFVGYGLTHRAVPGHKYGLKLSGEEKTALMAFLRTL